MGPFPTAYPVQAIDFSLMLVFIIILLPGDHVCWLFEQDSDFCALAVDYIAAGIETNMKV